MNILPFGGIGVWRATYNSKKRKKVMDGVGGVGGSYSGGAAAEVAPTPSDGAASAGTESPGAISGVDSGSSENAEKFGLGQNNNMSQQSSVTNINMSTQDHMCMREMAGQGGSQESSGIDIKKLLEMMIALKMLDAMSSQGGGQ
jgi:hypothetical protein